MTTIVESRSSVPYSPRSNSPLISVLIARATKTGTTYTCPVCSVQCAGILVFRKHCRVIHNAINQDPVGLTR